MTEIGTVLSVTIGTGYRHEKQAVILTVRMEDPEDIREVEYLFPSGMNAIPSVEDQVIVHEISPEYLVATATNAGIFIVEEQGETAIYSVDADVVKASIRLFKNGEISLNEGDSSAVKFESLKEQFDTLKIDFNNFVSNYNAHIHVVTPPTPPATAYLVAPTIKVSTPTTVDISPAKSPTIRV